MIDDILKDADARMGKSIEALKGELTKLRTGRAHTSLLDHITVDYYGTETALNQVATVGVADARMLTVTPWEKNMVQAVEKAIMSSNLGLNPATSGTVIRVPLPALTEERRRDMIKVVRAEGEQAKVAIRNIRRDAIGDFKDLLKEKEISEDQEHQAEAAIQKITDKRTAEVDAVLEIKEKDLMEV
jgi:ribosome recycling factor